MTSPWALTLFVHASDPASNAAREALQAVLLAVPDDALVKVRIADEAEATALAVGIAPVLRVQRGNDTPEWIIKLDRQSLFDRLMAIGLLPAP